MSLILIYPVYIPSINTIMNGCFVLMCCELEASTGIKAMLGREFKPRGGVVPPGNVEAGGHVWVMNSNGIFCLPLPKSLHFWDVMVSHT